MKKFLQCACSLILMIGLIFLATACNDSKVVSIHIENNQAVIEIPHNSRFNPEEIKIYAQLKNKE